MEDSHPHPTDKLTEAEEKLLHIPYAPILSWYFHRERKTPVVALILEHKDKDIASILIKHREIITHIDGYMKPLNLQLATKKNIEDYFELLNCVLISNELKNTKPLKSFPKNLLAVAQVSG